MRMTRLYLFIIAIGIISIRCSNVSSEALNISSNMTTGEDSFFERLFDTKKPELDPESYITYCESADNGLIISKQMGDFEFTLFNKPLPYLAIKEFQESEMSSLSKAEIDKKIAEFGKMDYYSFRIANDAFGDEILKYNLESEEEYASRIEYFSFKMQNDFTLVCGKDTILPSLFHFERVFGLAPHATFILAFENNGCKGDKRLLFDDKIFNKGLLIFNYNQSDLNNIPNIKSYEK